MPTGKFSKCGPPLLHWKSGQPQNRPHDLRGIEIEKANFGRSQLRREKPQLLRVPSKIKFKKGPVSEAFLSLLSSSIPPLYKQLKSGTCHLATPSQKQFAGGGPLRTQLQQAGFMNVDFVGSGTNENLASCWAAPQKNPACVITMHLGTNDIVQKSKRRTTLFQYLVNWCK